MKYRWLSYNEIELVADRGDVTVLAEILIKLNIRYEFGGCFPSGTGVFWMKHETFILNKLEELIL